MNREGKKCVLYPRVSTEMQVDGYSLEGQKNGLKRFADREEMEIVGIYEDAGKSGKSIEGRPAFKKMLSDIGNGLEIDYILVYKLSRFGRNAADILNSLEYVQSYGVNLICIEEGIDSSQTSGKLLISVLSAVAEIERESFAKEIKKRFGVQTDTSKIDKELANYESKLKEVDLNKARLEREIDNLPADAKYRERKIHDMTIRLDGLYDTIVELEERIEDAKLRRSSIEMEAITLENVYRIMENFSKLYAIISDEEKKSLVSYLIKEIQIYPNGTSDRILKSIEFNFPIYRDGREIRKLLWENGNTVEAVCLLTKE